MHAIVCAWAVGVFGFLVCGFLCAQSMCDKLRMPLILCLCERLCMYMSYLLCAHYCGYIKFIEIIIIYIKLGKLKDQEMSKSISDFRKHVSYVVQYPQSNKQYTCLRSAIFNSSRSSKIQVSRTKSQINIKSLKNGIKISNWMSTPVNQLIWIHGQGQKFYFLKLLQGNYRWTGHVSSLRYSRFSFVLVC